MKSSVKLLFVNLLFVGMKFISSCNNPEMTNNVAAEKTGVNDYINALNALSMATVDEITAGEDNDLKSAQLPDCVTVTNHPNNSDEFWAGSWTSDYGSENCECYSGVTRRGIIHVTLSDRWRNEGSLREFTFEDFYFNDKRLEGVKTCLNTGVNEQGNLTFNKTVSDARLSYDDAAGMSWECEKFGELIQGYETIALADDVWSVAGSGKGN